MKIAIFADPYLDVSGGIASSVSAQKAELMRLGHTVKLFAPGNPELVGLSAAERGEVESAKNAGAATFDPDLLIVPTASEFLKFGGAWTARWPEVVMEWIDKNYPEIRDFDIIHVHYEAGCSLAGMLLAKKYRIPLVVTMHGREDVAIATNVSHPFKRVAAGVLKKLHGRYIPNKIVVKRDNYLATSRTRADMWTLMVNHANYANLVVVPSQHFADKLKHYGVKKPMAVISNGINDEMFRKFPNKPRVWDGRRPLQIIWNSRVSKEKRIIPFLEALTHVKGDFYLHVYGEGNEFFKAQDFIRETALDAKVKLYGRTSREEVWERLKTADLSVVNSYGFDNQPMVLLEAEVAGVPTIFCDGDMREIGPTGGSIYVDGPEMVKMAEALNKLFDEPERIEKMSEAMLRARGELRESKVVGELVEQYQKLMK